MGNCEEKKDSFNYANDKEKITRLMNIFIHSEYNLNEWPYIYEKKNHLEKKLTALNF